MVKFVLASLVILAVLVGWLYVQELYRRFAQRHPDLGPYRKVGGCDGSCSCSQGSCPTTQPGSADHRIALDLVKRSDDPGRIRGERE